MPECISEPPLRAAGESALSRGFCCEPAPLVLALDCISGFLRRRDFAAARLDNAIGVNRDFTVLGITVS
jgi:hypothetical protein